MSSEPLKLPPGSAKYTSEASYQILYVYSEKSYYFIQCILIRFDKEYELNFYILNFKRHYSLVFKKVHILSLFIGQIGIATDIDFNIGCLLHCTFGASL